MKPQFGEHEEDWGSQLLCPACEGNWTHHDHIDVFERKEDAESGIHVSVTEGSARFDISMEGNPSSRRHGLSVRFWCETCGAISLLSIFQHKGITYMRFVDTGEKMPGY